MYGADIFPTISLRRELIFMGEWYDIQMSLRNSMMMEYQLTDLV